jgi:hypothetical protein
VMAVIIRRRIIIKYLHKDAACGRQNPEK